MSNITKEFARRDDCLDRIVPSDLRALVNDRDQCKSDLEVANNLTDELTWERDQLKQELQQQRLMLQAENERLRTLVVRSYRTMHRDSWQDGETESELTSDIASEMTCMYGHDWQNKPQPNEAE